MTEREFVEAFEACTLPASSFHHADHVRLAFLYLREEPLLPALQRYVTNLRRFAKAHGATRLYHETITFAFIFVIHERMQRDAFDDFDTFAAANPDLLTWKPSVLDRYYTPETLASERARRSFVMPDR
jgi:hypothetical protein